MTVREPETGREALLYSRRPNGEAACALCPHRCVIGPGQRGLCAVRENRDGRLFALTYGRAAARGAEPVEKRPLYHFLPGTRSYAVGAFGCNMTCDFCINSLLSQPGHSVDPASYPAVSPEEIVREAIAENCASIAFTFVEPTIFFEYALEISRLARSRGLRVVLKTNGMITAEALELWAPYLDAVNVDLKAFRPESYHAMGGKREPVLDCVRMLAARGIWLEATTVVLPGLNDSAEELREMARFLAREVGTDTPWHVARFFPAYRLLELPPTPPASLHAARHAGAEAGLRYVYLSNDVGPGSRDTHCPSCAEPLLERHAGGLVRNRLRQGACPGCGARVAGRWEERA